MKVEAPEHPAGEAGTSGTRGGRPFNEELLIKEAKRRHRRRLALLGTCVLVLAGLIGTGAALLSSTPTTPHRPPPRLHTPPPATSLPSNPAVPASDPTCTTPQLAIDYRGLGAGTGEILATFRELLILRPRRALFAQASRLSSLTRKETSASHRRGCPRTLRSRPTRPCHRLGRTHLLMSSLGSSCWDIPPYRTPSSSSPVVWAVSVPNRSSHPT